VAAPRAADLPAGPAKEDLLPAARARAISTVPEQRPDRSAEASRLLEDMQNLAVRLAHAQAPLATSSTAGRQEDSPHAEAPAWVAAPAAVADITAVAAVTNRRLVLFPAGREI